VLGLAELHFNLFVQTHVSNPDKYGIGKKTAPKRRIPIN
jgi:hypothetical protein